MRGYRGSNCWRRSPLIKPKKMTRHKHANQNEADAGKKATWHWFPAAVPLGSQRRLLEGLLFLFSDNRAMLVSVGGTTRAAASDMMASERGRRRAFQVYENPEPLGALCSSHFEPPLIPGFGQFEEL